MNIKTAETVLNNLYLIKENKDEIIKCEKLKIPGLENTHNSKHMPFVGVCSNCDTYSLDQNYFENKKLSISILYYVHIKFIDSKGGAKTGRDTAYPVLDTYELEKWENSERWELVDFWIDFLNRLINDTENVLIEIDEFVKTIEVEDYL